MPASKRPEAKQTQFAGIPGFQPRECQDHGEGTGGGAVIDRTWWLRSAGDWRRARERVGGYAYLRPADRSLVFTVAVPTVAERRRFERW